MLRTPPFKRALFLSFRHPAVMVALVVAGTLLGVVTALTPQFVSASTSEALERELLGRCPTSYAGSLSPIAPLGSESRSFSVTAANFATLRAAVSDHPHIGEPIATIEAQTVQVRPSGESFTIPLVLLHRTGFQDHVDLVAGGDSPGVWIDEFTADELGVWVGDEIPYELFAFEGELGHFEGGLPVAAIVGDLIDRHTDDFWCGAQTLIAPGPFGDRPPGVALVDLDVFGAGRFSTAPVQTFFPQDQTWEIPVVADGITLADSAEVLSVFSRVGEDLVGDPDRVRSDLQVVAPRVVTLKGALSASTQPLAVVVFLTALGLVGAAGSYWVDRRSGEIKMLSVLGVGPVGFGFKAFLESLIPIALGLTAGAALSIPLTSLVGPGGEVEGAAVREGFQLAVLGGLSGLLILGLVAGVRSAGIVRSKRKRARGGGLWLILVLLIAAAIVIRIQIGDSAVRFGEGDLIGTVNPLVVLYPFLVLAAAALLAGAVFLGIVSWLGKRRVRAAATYLASRRLATFRIPLIVLVVGVAVPVGVFVYASSLTRSTEVTIGAKGRVFIGSDVRAPVYETGPLPERLGAVSTFVQRADRVDFEGTTVDLLAIDTDTFSKGAFWDPTLAEIPLPELLEAIEASDDTRIGAIVANAEPPADEGIVNVGRLDIPVIVTARASSFPGARRDRPLVVVSQANLDRLIEESQLPVVPLVTWIWTAGLDEDVVQDDLREAGIGFSFTTSAERALDLTRFQVVIWTFDFLRLYAALAGVIVVGGILLYVDSRQRARNLSYVLARRMGLKMRDHFLATLIEIGSVVGVGAVIGGLTAAVGARSLYRILDPLPEIPPTPRWEAPLTIFLIVMVLAAGLSLVAAWLAQRTADRADVPGLLRHGDN